MIAQTFLEAKGFAPVSELPATPSAQQPEEDEFDREYAAWKHENGLNVPLTAQQVADFITYELSRC